MKAEEIHIDEENIQFFWGLASLVCIALASYLLINAFMAGSWQIAGYKQIGGLLLFMIGFYGIIRISTPLFHFVLKITGDILTIEIWQEGDEPLDIKQIKLDEMTELRVSPHRQRSADEALFDFSTGYHLLYRPSESEDYEQLIKLEEHSFTLKVEDIKRIMQFLKHHREQILIPDSSVIFLS